MQTFKHRVVTCLCLTLAPSLAFATELPPRELPTGASTVSISRAPGTSEVLDEGGALGVTIEVKNAVKGQTFDLSYLNEMSEADFANGLAADLATSGLPEGVTVSPSSARKATITLKEGTYSFGVYRRIALDSVPEARDQAPWAAGNQEQADIFILNPTGGLRIGANVVSTWVSDSPAELTKVALAESALATISTGSSLARVGEAAKVSITRTLGTPQLMFEGVAMGVTVQITNAVRGQVFHLWHANTMDEADFTSALLTDVTAGLPDGVTAVALAPMRVAISLKEGTYAFTIRRQAALDGITESTDQAHWMAGNQEQTDIFISDPTGGLKVDAHVVSNWVTDTARTTAAMPH
jgi:hypothetical protein